MKKNLILILGLVSIVLLVGCGKDKVDNAENIEPNTINNGNNVEEGNIEYVDPDHPDWIAISLTTEDLDRIDQTTHPLSYSYQTYNSKEMSLVDFGEYKSTEGEISTLSIPEYEGMVSREVISSGIEDDMIYTTAKLILQDGNERTLLYINEPNTLLCRAISVINGDLTTLYTDFVYLEE